MTAWLRANNGLDLEMPNARSHEQRKDTAGRDQSRHGERKSTIDEKVVRLLRTVLRYGFLDRPQFDPVDSTYSVADRAVTLDAAARA